VRTICCCKCRVVSTRLHAEVDYENETQLARNRKNNKADAIVGGLGISTIDKTRRREYESTRVIIKEPELKLFNREIIITEITLRFTVDPKSKRTVVEHVCQV
ncbi:hypothetical protein G9C98_007528, partial [Cotesia typhae]